MLAINSVALIDAGAEKGFILIILQQWPRMIVCNWIDLDALKQKGEIKIAHVMFLLMFAAAQIAGAVCVNFDGFWLCVWLFSALFASINTGRFVEALQLIRNFDKCQSIC